MKKYLLVFSFYMMLAATGHASEPVENEQSLITSVLTLKNIIHNALNEKQARSELGKIPNTQPFMKNGQYVGHQLIVNGKLAGIYRVRYQQNTPVLAAYSTVPLKVRNATKMYKAYRATLLKHHKEASYNHFDLGNGITAELSKKLRSLSIFVSRKNN